MSTYRPRPDDHLVEPLYGGLAGADTRPVARGRVGHATLTLALAILAGALIWLV